MLFLLNLPGVPIWLNFSTTFPKNLDERPVKLNVLEDGGSRPAAGGSVVVEFFLRNEGWRCCVTINTQN